MTPPAAVLDEISFLARAPSRVRILVFLSESGPTTKRELRGQLSQSRSTISRGVDSLVEAGWLRERSDRVELTPTGALVIQEFLGLAETMATAEELSPFLEWFPVSEFDLAVEELQSGTVTGAVDGDPYAPARKHTNRIRTAERLRALLPSIGQNAISEIHRRILAGDLEATLIVSSSVETRIRTTQLAPQFEEMLSTDRLTVLVTESVPFFLGLVDDRTTQIGVEDDNGIPRALFETDAEAVREWAEALFADYREASSSRLMEL
ncbi:MAG: MarR family transcriptional regulator [Euryarchaeota archaeon]|nr:MarR family transcriptional regulator [Euryarchaeota archaeon]